VGDLLALLEQEAATYARLLHILREEEAAVLAGRHAGVAACASRKETLLLELRMLAESRGVLLSRLAETFDVPVSSLTLSGLTALVDPDDATRLCAIRTSLAETLSETAQATHGLGLLLERSLSRIREILRILKESSGPQYDSAGRLLVPAFPALDQEA
jgi:flagellar biosynthesis/type III secretory pathway chaperone